MPFRNYGLNWKWSRSVWDNGMWGTGRDKRPVKLNNQIGIYTLEQSGGRSDRHIVYLGKTGTGPTAGILGRLYGHTTDDKAGKWNSFSWFGIRPVRSSGTLVRTPSIRMDTGDLIMDIEAVLIYLLKLPENKTSGRYKHIDKYNQHSTDE